MKKKLQLIISTLFMVLAGLTTYGQVGSEFTVGDLVYRITSSTAVEIVDYTTTGGVVDIPQSVNHNGTEYDVTRIGESAFSGNNLNGVNIGENVNSIGERAFNGNLLPEVTIPGGVTDIGQDAFSNNLINMVIVEPDHPPTLDVNAFRSPRRFQMALVVPLGRIQAYENAGWTGFRSITEGDFIVGSITYAITALGSTNTVTITDNAITGGVVNIPQSVNRNGTEYDVTRIGEGAFFNNELTSVALPESVTYIGSNAFSSNQLTSVTIPSGVISIGNDAFANNALTSVGIPNTVTSIGASAFALNQLENILIPSNLTSIEPSVFFGNKLATVTIPSMVTTIGDFAFQANELTSVTLPNSVTSIGNSAFGNNQLTQVRVEADDPPALHEDAFASFGQTIDNRDQIDLIVPPGKGQQYLDNGWTNFKSITEEPFTYNGIDYRITSVNPRTVEVIGRAGGSTDTEVTIPSTVSYGQEDYTITSIGPRAFFGNQLDNVTIPEGVTTIGNEAFRENQLTNVTIPSSVESIGNGAFFNNNLTSVDIPNNVTHIGAVAFQNNDLTSVEISNSVTTIESGAFRENQLTNVTIPSSVESIGNGAFFNNNLTSVEIPNNVTHIGAGAFRNNDLTSVEIPNSVTSMSNSAFSNNLLTSVIIGENLTRLDALVFGDNPLTSLRLRAAIPPTLGSSNVGAFTNRGNIHVVVPEGALDNYETAWNSLNFQSITESVGIGGDFIVEGITYNITALGSTNTVTITDNTNTGDLTIPGAVTYQGTEFEVTAIGDRAFLNNDLTSVVIPDGVINIGESAFRDNQLTSVGIPNSVTSIGDNAFRDNQLTQVTIPDDVTSISTAAFMDNQLASVDIPNGVTSIGAHAFHNNQLTEVTLPDGVTSIGNDAFRNNQLTSVEVPNGVASIEASTFRENALTSVTLPSSVTSIGGHAFRDNQLASVDIPDGVTSIGAWAFRDNLLQGHLVIPNSVTSMGTNTFSGNQLTSVEISNGLTSIGAHAFRDNQLTSVEVPNGVASIGESAFRFNNLTSVTLPSSVTSIGTSAFGGDNPLTSVRLLTDTPPGLGTNTFGNRAQIDVIVPEGALGNYQNHAQWEGFNSIVVADFTSNGLDYRRTSLNPARVEVTGRAGGSTDTDITIPGTVSDGSNNFEVTAIGDSAFRDNQLTDVAIGGNVTHIGRNAFRDNDLTSVTLPESVTNIGVTAFQDNNLTSVTLPESVTDIAYEAFKNNPGLATVVLKGATPPSINANAFRRADRDEIDLFVPAGRRQAYLDNGWTGFKSITEPVIFTIDAIADAIIDENTAYTSVLPSITGTPVGTVTYTLGGTDAGLFTIDSATGQVGMMARDFEAPADANADNIYEVSITATDDDSNSASEDWTVTIRDVNEAAAFTIDPIADAAIDENTAYTSVLPSITGTPVGTVTYTLGGTDAGSFTIDPATGQVGMMARDFEAPADANADNIYEVSITATDEAANSASEAWTVTIQAATFTIDPIADAIIDENMAYTSVLPSITGTPVGTVTYTLGGTDAGLFTIDPASGQVGMMARDFEAPTDANADNVYEVSITATDDDANSASEAWTVAIRDVNEIPNNALLVLVKTPSCTGSADGSVAVITDVPGYLMDISIGGGTMEDRFFNDIASGGNFEIDGLGVGDYTVTVTIPEISLERTFGATVNGMGPVSGKRESLDRKEGRATYVVSGSDRYEVSVNGGKMDFAFGDTGPQSIQLENLYGRTEVVISGRNGCQGKVTDSFFMDSVLAEVYPTVTSSFITILTQGGHLDVQVHTLSGRLVEGARFTERENIMDLSFVESGMYILKMASKGKEQTIKIIKR